MEFKLCSLIALACIVSTVNGLGQRPQDPYTIKASHNFEDSNHIQQSPDPSPFKNGARPSFRQYNTGTSYQQQYGVYSSNGQQQNGQYMPYDNNQQYSGQRYPQYGTDGTNQNGFQRDPRFNGAQSIGTSAALCSAAFLTLMRFVFN